MMDLVKLAGLLGVTHAAMAAGNAAAHALPPSPSRMLEVASGLSTWSSAEDAWLLERPTWIEYELRLRAGLKMLGEEVDEESLRELTVQHRPVCELEYSI